MLWYCQSNKSQSKTQVRRAWSSDFTRIFSIWACTTERRSSRPGHRGRWVLLTKVIAWWCSRRECCRHQQVGSCIQKSWLSPLVWCTTTALPWKAIWSNTALWRSIWSGKGTFCALCRPPLPPGHLCATSSHIATDSTSGFYWSSSRLHRPSSLSAFDPLRVSSEYCWSAL